MGDIYAPIAAALKAPRGRAKTISFATIYGQPKASLGEIIDETPKTKSKRGFASMADRVRQREIASAGGKAAHANGTAHKYNSEEARAAGKKGGLAVSRNREHMAKIGRRGGHARSSQAFAPAAGAGKGLESGGRETI